MSDGGPSDQGMRVDSMRDEGAPFWQQTALDALTPDQWEALCDGCGLCCQVKLLDADDPRDDAHAEVFLTDVACRLLDCDRCRCGDYAHRKQRVPECIVITPESLPGYLGWLPQSCGYVRRYHGLPLPSWHPLRTGDPLSVHRDGPGMAGRLISERRVPDEALEDHIIAWPAAAQELPLDPASPADGADENVSDR